MRAWTSGVAGGAGLAAALLVVVEVEAAGLSVARFGGEQGTPVSDNPTALYYNPAGISLSQDGLRLFVDLTVAWRAASYEHTEGSPRSYAGPGAETNYGKASLFNVIPSPMLGLVYADSGFAVGAGFYTPFGGQARWGKRSEYEGNAQYPGAVDGVQRWYTIDGVLRASYVGLGAAYQLAPQLSAGLVGNLIVSRLDTLRARNADGTDNVPNEGRSLLEVSGLDWSLGAGVLVRPDGTDHVRLGLSYQTGPGITGQQRLEGTLTNNFGGVVSESEVDLVQDLPEVVRWGISWAPASGPYELRLFGDYTRWSALEYQCVVPRGEACNFDARTGQTSDNVIQNQARKWKDTFGVRAGGSYHASRTLEAYAGLGYASNAVPNGTLEPAVMDFDSFTITGGVRVELGADLYLSPSYTQVVYLSRDTTGQSNHSGFAPRSNSPDSGGKYSQSVGVLSVGLDVVF